MALGSKPLPKTDRIKAACGGILRILKFIYAPDLQRFDAPTFSGLCAIRWRGESSLPIKGDQRWNPLPKHLPVQCVYLSSHGNRYNVEFPTISAFNPVGGSQIVYQRTKDRNLPALKDADILWLGQGEICEDRYRLTKERGEKDQSVCERGRCGHRFGARQR